MATQIIVSGAPVNQANSVMILAGNTRVNAFTTSINSADAQDSPNYLTNFITNATGLNNSTFGSGLVGGPQILVNGVVPGNPVVDKSINTSVPLTQTRITNEIFGQVLTMDGRIYDGQAQAYNGSTGSTQFNISGGTKSFGNDAAAENGWAASQKTIINLGGQGTGMVT